MRRLGQPSFAGQAKGLVREANTRTPRAQLLAQRWAYKPRLRRAPLAPLVQPKVEQERLRRLALRASACGAYGLYRQRLLSEAEHAPLVQP